MSAYQQEYLKAQTEPESFWREQSEALAWFEKPKTILANDENGIERWFPDGVMNTAYLALDYHCEQGRGEKTALIYDSPVTGKKQAYTYNELRDKVAKIAGMLAGMGVEKGDRVVIYMPMVPEAAMAMLACARLGAIHSVVFGGFASNELAVRIEDAEPKVLMTASCGIEVSKVIPYKPLVDQPLWIAAGSRKKWWCCSALSAKRRWIMLAMSTGKLPPMLPSRMIVCLCSPPTRSISSTHQARRANLKAWCAITAVMPSQ